MSLVARENLLIRKNEWLPGTGPSPSKPNPAAFHSNGPSNEGFKFVPSHHKRGKSGKKKNHYHSNNSSNDTNNNKSSSPPNGNMGRHTSWKKIAPAKNESQQKIVNGKTFYWCQYCNRWTTSHSTETHRDPRQNDGSNNNNHHNGNSNSPPPPPKQRAYPFFAASFLVLSRPVRRSFGGDAAATAEPNRRSFGQRAPSNVPERDPEPPVRTITTPRDTTRIRGFSRNPIARPTSDHFSNRPVQPPRLNPFHQRTAPTCPNPIRLNPIPQRVHPSNQARNPVHTTNHNAYIASRRIAHEHPRANPIPLRLPSTVRPSTKQSRTTPAAPKPSYHHKGPKHNKRRSDTNRSNKQRTPKDPPTANSFSFFPTSFLVFTLSVMLTIWWVSTCLKMNTGQPYAAFYPEDPLSILFPDFRMYRRPPDKFYGQPNGQPRSYSARSTPHSAPAPSSPPTSPSNEFVPPRDSAWIPQVPTFTTSATAHDDQLLDDLINSIGSSYYATSYTSHSISEQLAFYSTNDFEDFLIIDTGATSSSSCHLDDFEESTYRKLSDATVHGISGSPINITGVGFVNWQVNDSKGHSITLRSPATHLPQSDVRLFSPQRFFQTCDKCLDTAHFTTYRNHSVLWLEDDITIHCNHPRGLPIVNILRNQSDPDESIFVSSKSKTHPIPPLTLPSNQNLTNPEKLMLLWHYRLGHIGFDWVKHLGRCDLLGSIGKTVCNVKTPPKCTACIYARQHCRPTGDTNEKRLHDMKMKKDILIPGHTIAVDQYVCSKKGRLLTSAGCTRDSEMYCGGTMFIDLATQRIKIYHQTSFSAADTVRSKQIFERDCMRHGVPISTYQSDNGVFTAVEFVSELEECLQARKLAGVGAHHHNGIVENAIRTVTERARAMMLHASLHWPEVYDESMWPNAMSYAVQLWNHTPRMDTSLSPEEVFSSSIQHSDFLLHTRVWGCPAYVLDPTLHDKKKIPRWQPRSRRGQFVGFSDEHPFTVGYIRNLDTERITPQFHVVYDHKFETTYCPEGVAPIMWPDLVAESFIDFPFGSTDDDDDIDPPPFFRPDVDWLSPAQREHHHPIATNDVHNKNTTIDPDTKPISDAPRHVTFARRHRSPTPPRPRIRSPPPTDPDHDDIEPTIVVPKSRRARPVRPNKRYLYNANGTHGYNTITDPFVRSAMYLHHMTIDPVTHFVDVIVPHLPGLTEGLFSARKKRRDNPDTPMYHQAMQGPHRAEFVKAMSKELDSITNAHAWTPILRTTMPDGACVVPGTWSFRIKRYPDGRIRDYKARYNVRGDLLEHGVDFTDSPYAPLVQWSTVRLMLVVGSIQNLYSCCVDFKNAFAQAPLDDELYLELPQGFDPPDKRDWVLRLENSLYGHPGSSHIWSEHLAKGLTQRGFKRSSLDPCLFIHDDMVCLVYCDDCLWWAQDPDKLNAMLDDLAVDYPLTKEAGDVYSYLGVEVRREGETITLTQTGLIQDIIESTNMTNCSFQSTPANIQPLGSDPNGDPTAEPWSYASIIGKLNYLANNTRPDIAFATHQCARFTHRPKRSHEIAIKKIVRYLAGTANQGIKFNIDQTKLDLTCYADADFAGLWGVEDPEDKMSSKSRTGYVIFFGGCPLVWASKLQTDTALCTMEAEYISLSQCMRELIPMRALVAEVLIATKLMPKYNVQVKSTVFEDNQACIAHAVAPKMSPRTKHIGVKYHFFRHHIADGEIEVHYVDTNNQVADMLTKGLPPEKFKFLRRKLMGW